MYEALVFTFVFAVYVNTLYPSIAGGDSGELVAESCHLGVSHPPGYPLYNMLTYLAMQLPTRQSKAFNANALSAFWDSVCAMLVYKIIAAWSTNKNSASTIIAATTAAMLFAFSPVIWTYAVGAEVFAMNNAIATGLLYLALRYAAKREMKYAYYGALLSGIGMCNQHTIILLEIPIVLMVFWTERKELSIGKIGKLGGLFFVGLLPYLYMPITSYYNPQHGSWGDVQTLKGFWHHLIRADYGTFKLYSTDEQTEGLCTRLVFYFTDLVTREGLYVIAPLGLIGIIISCKNVQKRKNQSKKSIRLQKKTIELPEQDLLRTPLVPIGYWMVFAYLLYLIGFHSLSNLPLTEGLLYGIHMRFWQQPNIISFIWLGIGLLYIINKGLLVVKKKWLISTLAAVLCSGLVLLQIHRWRALCDQSDGWYIHNYAKALIGTLPKGALFFTNYDLQWTSLRYLQRCENFRQDVTLVHLSMMTYKWFEQKHNLYPHMQFPGTHLVSSHAVKPLCRQEYCSNGFSMKQLVDANYGTFKKTGVYIGGKLSFHDNDFNAAYSSVPHGLLTRFVPTPNEPKLAPWYKRHKKVMRKVSSYLPALPPSKLYDDQSWEWTVARDYHMHRVEQSVFLLDKAITENASLAHLIEAARPMEYSLTHEPKEFFSDALLKNLGLAYMHMVKSTEKFNESSNPFEDYVGVLPHKTQSLADRATIRMLQVWGKWIKKPSAKKDAAYKDIKKLVKNFQHLLV